MNKLIPITKLSETELKDLGLKSGIEIHQQLDGCKLFCSCPTTIRDDKADFIISRKLRAIAGESGKIDKAAAAEQKKQKYFIYEGYDDSNCLVELDEMPPQNINSNALNSSYIVGKLFNMTFPDQIRFMRKTVVNGSNTSGFQRTAQIAVNGEIKLRSTISESGKINAGISELGKQNKIGNSESASRKVEDDFVTIGVESICLEEDSAKDIEETADYKNG